MISPKIQRDGEWKKEREIDYAKFRRIRRRRKR